MSQINIDALINKVNDNIIGDFIIEFEGIITTKKEIKNLKIREEKDYIVMFDSNIENDDEEIKLSKHKIMKIEESTRKITIKFDTLQNVKIRTKENCIII